MMSFDLWATADPDAQGGGTFDPPADGVYEVALVKARIVEKEGTATIYTTFRDVVSDYEWVVSHGFKSQAQANVTKKTCRTLGVDIDNITSQQHLDEALGALVGQYFAVTVKTNGQYRNTYIDGPASGDTPTPRPAAAPVAAATGDGDIPF